MNELQSLNQTEVARLQELEDAIHDGITSFVQVGQALLEINSSRLYREDYKTFEEYCHKRWGFSRSYAYRQITARNIAQMLSPMGDNGDLAERHLRELAPVMDDPDEVRAVWAEVQESDEPVTAEVIRTTVRKRMNEVVLENDAAAMLAKVKLYLARSLDLRERAAEQENLAREFMIKAVQAGATDDEIEGHTGLPAYKVRSLIDQDGLVEV